MGKELSLELIGKRLKEIRKGIGLNQGDISDILGKKQVAISYVESGKSCGTSFLFKLLNYYSDYIYVEDIFKTEFDFFTSRQRFLDQSVQNDIDDYHFTKNKEKLIKLKKAMDDAFDEFANDY